MDGMILLLEARRAGLKLSTDGDRLLIRGPKIAEPLVRRIIANKPIVVAALAEQSKPAAYTIPEPPTDRPGFVTVVEKKGGNPQWLQRPFDDADRAYAANLDDPSIAIPLTSEGIIDPEIPAGWTRLRWIARLRTLADTCEQIRPDMAATHRAEANRLETTQTGETDGN